MKIRFRPTCTVPQSHKIQVPGELQRGQAAHKRVLAGLLPLGEHPLRHSTVRTVGLCHVLHRGETERLEFAIRVDGIDDLTKSANEAGSRRMRPEAGEVARRMHHLEETHVQLPAEVEVGLHLLAAVRFCQAMRKRAAHRV